MPTALELLNITKTYPGVVALSEINFKVNFGEVRALLGKNGAGKSTLVKILSGVVQPDGGEIYISQNNVKILGPTQAFRLGISTVYQELSLIPSLTVAENILLGRWGSKKYLGFSMIDSKRVYQIAGEILEKLCIDLPLNKLVRDLSVTHRQLCEIAKAISFDPKVLILDEPTSALSKDEVRILHAVVRNLRDQGHSIIYVTHRLQEVPSVADSVTVLRDGKVVDTLSIDKVTIGQIARMMVGDEIAARTIGQRPRSNEKVLSVIKLYRKGVLKNISFELFKGEILGIAGLLGSGRTELIRCVLGLDPFDSGTISVKDKVQKRPNPRRMLSKKISLIPEDRKKQGLIPLFSVKTNLVLSCEKRVSKFGVLNFQEERNLAGKSVDDLSIKASSIESAVQALSGGNQQKVILGKCLNAIPDILLLDEPTRGIDILAKQQIFQLLRYLVEERNIAMILVSSELEEVLQMADRIIIIRDGAIVGEVRSENLTIEALTEMVVGDDSAKACTTAV